MNRTIKGRRLGNNVPIKGSLHIVEESRSILFEEKNTKDRVNINCSLKKGQYGVYSEEYLPETVMGEGHKRADITALVMDEDENIGNLYLADVKSDIGGEDVIFHLCEQWQDGLKYMNHGIICYLNDSFEMHEKLMVITRNFDTERIKKEIGGRKRRIEELKSNSLNMLSARKQLAVGGAKMQKEMELLGRFVQKKFIYKEGKQEREYIFSIGILEEKRGRFEYDLEVSL